MLAQRLRQQLHDSRLRAVPFAGDVDEEADTAGTPAAVLIAVIDTDEPSLILTQRPMTMRRHAGQVAFPGGRVDPDDKDCVAAALREAHEEVALHPSVVEIVGTLSPYVTITGYRITPVLGVIPPGLTLVANDAEVAAVFEVPLAFVLDSANVVEQRMMINGRARCYREILWADRRIWGATAAMLVNLAARLA